MRNVRYEEAAERMTEGLLPYLPRQDARHFAEIFAGNSLDGVHSHGMNRYPRYLEDMDKGLCDRTVTRAEKVSAFGGLEVWNAHFGIGPLIAEQMTERVIRLAKEHGIACCALRNNSHWLRAGRYGLMIADAGLAGICFTNTCMNITAWGAKQPSTGNNPITMALPGPDGSLVMDMAVSQYAYGKLEIMAQEGKMLPQPCGYDGEGRETCDPAEICKSSLMLPMGMWKGSALSIMLDLMAALLAQGRTSHEIGTPQQGEKGMSQVYIAMHPGALGDLQETYRRLQESIDFLHGIAPADGKHGVHIPGEGLEETRRRNRENGIPVTEETWERILRAAERGRKYETEVRT